MSMAQKDLIVNFDALHLVFIPHLLWGIWHCWLTTSLVPHLLTSLSLWLFLSLLFFLWLILSLCSSSTYLPFSQKVVLTRVFVLGSLLFFNFCFCVIYSMPEALNKMYTVHDSIQVLYFLHVLCKKSPLEICPNFFSEILPTFSLLSNNIISINSPHANWKPLIILDSFFLLSFPHPVSKTYCFVSESSLSNLLLPFDS